MQLHMHRASLILHEHISNWMHRVIKPLLENNLNEEQRYVG